MTSEYKPRLIHFHFFTPIHPLIAYASWLTRTRTVCTYHFSPSSTLSTQGVKNVIKKRIRQLLTARIDSTICISKFIEQFLQDQFLLSPNKTKLIYNCVDMGRYNINEKEKQRLNTRNALNISNSDLIVTYIGQLIPEKGIIELLEMANNIKQTKQHVHFIIAGDGPLKDRVLTHQKNGIIHYLGQINNVDELLAASDIFIAPSKWQEAFGYTIAEAQVLGVPVIAADIGGIGEIVINNETGFLIRNGSTEDYASKLNELLDDDTLRARMSKATLPLRDKFDIKHMINATIDVYERLLNRHTQECS